MPFLLVTWNMKASKNILLRNRQKLHAKEVYFTCSRKITYSKCIYTRNFSISSGTDNDRLNAGKLMFPPRKKPQLKCKQVYVYKGI